MKRFMYAITFCNILFLFIVSFVLILIEMHVSNGKGERDVICVLYKYFPDDCFVLAPARPGLQRSKGEE